MNELIARFDLAVPAMWEPHLAPTVESVSAIEKRFGCRLPSLLLQFATHSDSFSSFFLGLGPDFGQHGHIINKNEFVRSDIDWLNSGPRAPDNLVFITESFMEDYFWCLDINHAGVEHSIVFWSPSSSDGGFPVHPTFEHFIHAQLDYYEGKRRT